MRCLKFTGPKPVSPLNIIVPVGIVIGICAIGLLVFLVIRNNNDIAILRLQTVLLKPGLRPAAADKTPSMPILSRFRMGLRDGKQ